MLKAINLTFVYAPQIYSHIGTQTDMTMNEFNKCFFCREG